MDADNSNSIHSGHFMVSCIYEADDDGEAVGSVKPEPYRQGYNFEAADWQLRKAYMFGSRSTNTLAIDASLTKLFECMTLAYRYVIILQQLCPEMYYGYRATSSHSSYGCESLVELAVLSDLPLLQ